MADYVSGKSRLIVFSNICYSDLTDDSKHLLHILCSDLNVGKSMHCRESVKAVC